MARNFVLNPILIAFDEDGKSLAGAKLYSYQAGTTTLTPLRTAEDLSTFHPNPLVADSAGRFPPIWAMPQKYKLVLTDANDVEIWTIDNYNVDEISTPGNQPLDTTIINALQAGIDQEAADRGAAINAVNLSLAENLSKVITITGGSYNATNNTYEDVVITPTLTHNDIVTGPPRQFMFVPSTTNVVNGTLPSYIQIAGDSVKIILRTSDGQKPRSGQFVENVHYPLISDGNELQTDFPRINPEIGDVSGQTENITQRIENNVNTMASLLAEIEAEEAARLAGDAANTATTNMDRSSSQSADAALQTALDDLSAIQAGQASTISTLSNSVNNGLIYRALWSELETYLTPADGFAAHVTNDPGTHVEDSVTVNNTGKYRKSGPAGTGEWIRVGDLVDPATQIMIDALANQNVETLAQAKSVSDPAKGSVYVKGRYEDGDGYGGRFYYQDVSTAEFNSDPREFVYFPSTHANAVAGKGWVRDRSKPSLRVEMGRLSSDPDDTLATQALADFVRTTHNGRDWDRWFDARGGSYEVWDEINCVGIREGAVRFLGEGGAFYGGAPNKIMFNFADCNAPRVSIKTIGAFDNPPLVGIYQGRTNDGSGFLRNAKLGDYRGAKTGGTYRGAGIALCASEVPNLNGAGPFYNRTITPQSCSVAIFGHMGAWDDFVGVPIVSAHAALQTAADGGESNILFDCGMLNALCQTTYTIDIDVLTQGTTTQVQSAGFTTEGVTTGDEITLRQTSESANNYKPFRLGAATANPNEFELLDLDGNPVDSSGWAASTGGQIQNRTGVGLFLNQVSGLSLTSPYFLVNGNAGIFWDTENGGKNRKVRIIGAQFETQPTSLIRFRRDSGFALVEGVITDALTQNGGPKICMYEVVGGGGIDLVDCKLFFGAVTPLPSEGLLHPVDKFRCYGFEYTQVAGELWPNGRPEVFDAKAYDRDSDTWHFFGNMSQTVGRGNTVAETTITRITDGPPVNVSNIAKTYFKLGERGSEAQYACLEVESGFTASGNETGVMKITTKQGGTDHTTTFRGPYIISDGVDFADVQSAANSIYERAQVYINGNGWCESNGTIWVKKSDGTPAS